MTFAGITYRRYSASAEGSANDLSAILRDWPAHRQAVGMGQQARALDFAQGHLAFGLDARIHHLLQRDVQIQRAIAHVLDRHGIVVTRNNLQAGRHHHEFALGARLARGRQRHEGCQGKKANRS